MDFTFDKGLVDEAVNRIIHDNNYSIAQKKALFMVAMRNAYKETGDKKYLNYCKY